MAKAPDAATATATAAVAVVEAVAHKVPVVTEAMVLAMVVTVDKEAADAVANTHLAHKVHGVHKAMVAAVKAVDVHPWVTRNRAATKADSAAAWASALPAPHPAANPIPCAPVSI